MNENNPKFFDTKLRAAKKFAKGKDNYNPYAGVCSMLPDVAKANADARQQYINGHFCCAVKAGIITNGLGVVRHISFFDDDFRKLHPEINVKKADNSEKDKEEPNSLPDLHAQNIFFGEAKIHLRYRTLEYGHGKGVILVTFLPWIERVAAVGCLYFALF